MCEWCMHVDAMDLLSLSTLFLSQSPTEPGAGLACSKPQLLSHRRAAMASFLQGLWDLNSGPCAFIESPLAMEPSQRTKYGFSSV